MKIMFKYSGWVLTIIVLLFALAGCGKEEKQFDFDNVAAVKIYTAQEEEVKQILSQKQTQQLIRQIGEIVWQEQKDEDTSEYEEWVYRIQCFSPKGEKKQNIYICSDSRILYKDYFWDAEEGSLDMTIYEKLFQQD